MRILKRLLPVFAIILWFIIGLICYAVAFTEPVAIISFMPFLFWLMSFCLVIYVAVGLILSITFTIIIWKKHKRVLAIIYILIWFAAGYVFWSDGIILGSKLRFLTEWHYYNKIVNTCYASDKIPDEVTRYQEYTIDPGPPMRIAFSWGGILDNWIGVVYDPTDEVLIINGVKSDWSNWGDPKFEKIKFLFGGSMYHTDHLFAHYYLCWFT